MMTNRTRGARGGSKLNRTLHESPATASLHSAAPKRKMFLAFRICARPIFSKMERTFFFLGFCPPSIQAVWRGFNADSVLRKLFSGKGFGKTSADFVCGAGRKRGVGKMNSRPALASADEKKQGYRF